MEYSCENMDWCFDELGKIISGICFLLLVARSLKIVKSKGLEPCSGQPVCLSNVDGIPLIFGLRNVVTRDQMSYMEYITSLITMFRQKICKLVV